jgi:hypothetical protein
MERQEGYYWVKYEGIFQIAIFEKHIKLSGICTSWYVCGLEKTLNESDFEHINENRIKEPGELPD